MMLLLRRTLVHLECASPKFRLAEKFIINIKHAVLCSTFLLFTFTFLPGSNLFAQTDSSKNITDTASLEAVTVTAFGGSAKWKDAPAAVAVINQTQLQRFDNKSLIPVLNTVSGVRMEERSPGSYRLSIRGSLLRAPFGVRNIKIYWNEIPFTDASGNSYLNLVDINNLQSIEVIKGPASSMYGANTGGVVLLKSDPSTISKKNAYKAGIEGGSFGLFNEQAGWYYKGKKISFDIEQSHLQSDGYRQQSTLRRDVIKRDVYWNINSKMQLSSLIFYSDLHYETPGGITQHQMDSLPTLARQPSGSFPGAVQQHAGVYNKTIFGGVSLKSVLDNAWSNITTLTINHTGFKNPFITNYEHRDELNYGGRTVFEFNHQNIKWLSGAEWLQNIAHINNYANNSGISGDLFFADRVRVAQYFLFTQFNVQLSNLTVQAGLSANQQTLKYNRVSDSVYNYLQHQNTNILVAPRISLLYKLIGTASLYGIIAKGFSPPTLAEVRPSTNQFYDLQPEYGWNIESGLKGSVLNNRLEFDASVYSFNLKHAIVKQTDSSGADFFVNAGGAKENGAEIFISGHIFRNNKHFIRNFTITNSFSYQPYKFNNYISGVKNYSGNRLTGVPKYINVSMLDLNTAPGIYMNANYNFTSSIPLTDANDVYAGSYNLLVLKLGLKKQFVKFGLDVFLGIDNLLNETYSLGNDLNAAGFRYFNPAPTRNYFGGIRINF